MTGEHRLSRRRCLEAIVATGGLIGATEFGTTTASAGVGRTRDDENERDGTAKKDHDGDPTGDGVSSVAFDDCYSTTVSFDRDFVEPAASGHVTLPTWRRNGYLEVPTAGTLENTALLAITAGNAYLAVPIVGVHDDYAELIVRSDGPVVETTRTVTVPIGNRTDESLAIKYAGNGDGYYEIPLKGGGFLELPAVGKADDAIEIPLENGDAAFPVRDDEGGYVSAPVVRMEGDSLVDVRIRTYNARKNRIENVLTRITIDDLQAVQTSGEIAYAWTFSAFQFYDRPLGAGDQVLSVTIDGETVENRGCAMDAAGSKRHEKTDDVGPNSLGLAPVCVDAETNLARYRVDNRGDGPVMVQYAVAGTDRSGSVPVEATSATYFEVFAPGGEASVALFYQGKTVDRRDSATRRACIPRGEVALDLECTDLQNGRAQWYVHNATDDDLTFVYRVAETGETGAITVEDSLASAETFWVGTAEGEATVTLYYEGVPIATASADPTDAC
ncbi:hypothetical protein AB7C87_06000 [Natrarchaeobius sp. A-rgal3]|uniref:hypothetical protein n=1 Tax=Natrarchaeobius versutus TaxID=1679078 RepID=UPI0035106CA9